MLHRLTTISRAAEYKNGDMKPASACNLLDILPSQHAAENMTNSASDVILDTVTLHISNPSSMGQSPGLHIYSVQMLKCLLEKEM